jgi:2,3-dihydroxy-p-cumate/2,3-dihydroxybenzoate 3,4-dioxygenase
MIKLHDIRYVRIGTRDVDRAVAFATNMIGLELVRHEGRFAYLRGDRAATRGDTPDHTLVYFEGDPGDHTIGLELHDPADFNKGATVIEKAGQRVRIGTTREASERRVQQFMAFRDPSGNRIEIVARPYQSGVRYHASRDAGLARLSHVGLRTLHASRDGAFWMHLCGMRVSDRIGEAALLRVGVRHHSLALYPSDRTGILHVSFAVEDLDDLMRSWHCLREQGVKILFGPGRDPSSLASFLYFEGPDQMIYAYSVGMRNIQPADETTYRPRQFPFGPESFCLWGARPDIFEFMTAKQTHPFVKRAAT